MGKDTNFILISNFDYAFFTNSKLQLASFYTHISKKGELITEPALSNITKLRNVCICYLSILTDGSILLVSRMLLPCKTRIYIQDIRGIEWHQLCHVLLQSIKNTCRASNPCVISRYAIYCLDTKITFRLD